MDVFGLPSLATPSGFRFLVSSAVLGCGPCGDAVGRVGFRPSQMRSHCVSLVVLEMRGFPFSRASRFPTILPGFTFPSILLGEPYSYPSAAKASQESETTVLVGGSLCISMVLCGGQAPPSGGSSPSYIVPEAGGTRRLLPPRPTKSGVQCTYNILPLLPLKLEGEAGATGYPTS